MTETMDAVGIAAAVRQGEMSAVEVVTAALKRIEARDSKLNCFTAVIAQALSSAEEIDRLVASGVDPGPLAGILPRLLICSKGRMNAIRFVLNALLSFAYRN